MSASLIIAAISCKLRSRLEQQSPLDHLWIDFRDCFGIVWAKRILDRMNEVAVTKQWPVQLQLHGLAWEDNVSASEAERISAEIEQNFRWMLKRFVNNEWIDSYLLTQTTTENNEEILSTRSES